MSNNFLPRYFDALSKPMKVFLNGFSGLDYSLHYFSNKQPNPTESRFPNALSEETMAGQPNHFVQETSIEIIRKNFSASKFTSEHFEATNRNIKLLEVVAITVTLVFVVLVNHGLVF